MNQHRHECKLCHKPGRLVDGNLCTICYMRESNDRQRESTQSQGWKMTGSSKQNRGGRNR